MLRDVEQILQQNNKKQNKTEALFYFFLMHDTLMSDPNLFK